MSRTKIEVSRKIHIVAPDDAAVSAAPYYARASGVEMIEDVREAAMHVKPDGSKHYYAKRIYERRSQDNGRTWVEGAEIQRTDPGQLDSLRCFHGPVILHPTQDALIRFHTTYEVDLTEGDFGLGCRALRTKRPYYQISHDGGSSWGPLRQVIDARSKYNETNWAPGVVYGVQGGLPEGQHVFLPDGTLVTSFDIMQPETPPSFPQDTFGYYCTTLYAQARLTEKRDALEWHFGGMISVEFPKSAVGCGEDALLWLGGQRLFDTTRCQGVERCGIYSTRYTAVSEDGGMTWSEPTPLVYDDGSTVWTPASPHRFFASSKTGKSYVIANILPGPVYGQTPRYPLTIAEFDAGRVCVLRDTVQVIQDLPEGAPKSRRYTNFSMYEERGTGDLILCMPEQPKKGELEEITRAEDMESDCIEFRVRLHG